MVLKDFIAVTNESGLFKFLAQGKNAIVAENIETQKRLSLFSSAKISALEEITLYTTGENIALSDVFDRIYDKENGGMCIDYKSEGAALKKYMAEILPEYDRDRVFVSDMKKLFRWYNILQTHNLLVKEEEAAPTENSEGEEK